jgi:5-(carboxyamino)imidazole ribonucleotide mutase
MSSFEMHPLVGVIMGSDSDLPTMDHASKILRQFNVKHEVRILSAHRTPRAMMEYAGSAVMNGLMVIIAGAGGSAHLPGMVASETRLPVLGVAIESQPDPLNAAIGSMIKMPAGAPLATMGKGIAGAVNAGLEAIRILALVDQDLSQAYQDYVQTMAHEVELIDRRLSDIGPVAYLDENQAN